MLPWQHVSPNHVGMTGLEPATSRPPDACANQLRYIPSLFAGAKVHTYYDICKLLGIFLQLQRKYLLNTHILKHPKASSGSRMHKRQTAINSIMKQSQPMIKADLYKPRTLSGISH